MYVSGWYRIPSLFCWLGLIPFGFQIGICFWFQKYLRLREATVSELDGCVCVGKCGFGVDVETTSTW
jgi:hypothetical protein